MNCEPAICCQMPGGQPGVQLLDDTWVVPWFEGAAPITSATIGRVSGQKRNAQRIDIPPWL